MRVWPPTYKGTIWKKWSSIYRVLYRVSASHWLFHLIRMSTVWSRCYYPHFADDRFKAQRLPTACEWQRFKLKFSDAETCAVSIYLNFLEFLYNSQIMLHAHWDRHSQTQNWVFSLIFFVVIKINRNCFELISDYNEMDSWAMSFQNKYLEFSVKNRDRLVA